MKGLKTLGAVLLAIAALACLVPASAGAAAYKHYVACGVSQNATPAHKCDGKRHALLLQPSCGV